MPTQPSPSQSSTCSRRQFLQRSAVAGATAYGAVALARGAHAAGSDTIKIGLIGCGGRGSGAAANAMNSGKDVRLVAMADIFAERIEHSRKALQEKYPEQMQVTDETCFVGFDAYEKVIQSADVVLIATTSHFQPPYLAAAVAAGKHVFCEKPHGLDVPGLKQSMAAAEEAKKKGLCLVSGLCWRYDAGVQETMKRVQDGAIGEIIAIQECYLTNPYLIRERKPEWNEMEYQFQNWYHFNWLSGDQTAQQLIHSIDKASWALGDVAPKLAWGMGGRQTALGPQYGDQFDHHAVVFEYANGVRVFAYCRDALGCFGTTSDIILGTKGQAFLPRKPHIEGANPWKYQETKPVSMYDAEHRELFDAIRSGKTINNGDYMCTSSMLAILAQMVCYTGQRISWEDAMNSQASFSLPRYGWDVEPPVKPEANGEYATAMPGTTKFR